MPFFNNRTPMRVRGILDLKSAKPQGAQSQPTFPTFPPAGRSGPTAPTGQGVPPAPPPIPGASTKPTPVGDILTGGAPQLRGAFGGVDAAASGVRGAFGAQPPPSPPLVASGGLVGAGNAPQAVQGPIVPAPASPPVVAGGGLVGPGNMPVSQTQTKTVSEADRNAAAAAASAGRATAASSAAAGRVGQEQEKANANAMATTSALADKKAGAPTPSTPTTTTPTTTPTPQQDLDEVRAYFQKLMTTQDDPVLRKQWNQLLISRGLENSAAMDALQMRINQDPALRGQPAGDTMLMEMVRDSGFSLDQARAQLSVEAANRVQELNRLGVEGFQKLAQYRLERSDAQRKELLAAGDFDGYAKAFKSQTGLDVDVSSLKSLSPATTAAVDSLSQAMVRNIESGNMDAARRNFESIKALAPTLYGQLTFEDAASGKDAFLLQSEARQAVGAMVRTQVSQGDLRGALAGIEQLMPDKAARVTAGSQATAATELAEINAALTAAGMSPVQDKAELIGREEDVWKALELKKLQSAAGKTVVDDTVGMLQGELQKMGYNITDPEASRALRSYALNLQLNGGLKLGADGKVSIDPNSVIPPWDPKSVDSHLFTDWPLLGADGKASSAWDPYGKDNPRPGADTALGRYYDELDGKWEDYLLSTPAAKRLTREQWFYATKAATQDPNSKDIPGGIVSETPDSTDTLTVESVLQKVRTNKPLEPADFESLRASSQFQTTVEGLPYGSNFKAWAEANPDRIATINGKVFRVSAGGSFENGHENTWGSNLHDDYVKIEDMETGTVYYVSDATDVGGENWYAEKPTSRDSKKATSPFGTTAPADADTGVDDAAAVAAREAATRAVKLSALTRGYR